MNPLIRKFQKIAEEAKLSKGTKKARLDFARLVRNEVDINNLGRVTRGLQKPPRLATGMLVAFEYKPKGINTLPFYDRFPLVFITEIKPDGWVGVNLHYLHPNVRANLFYQMDRKKVQFGKDDMTLAATKRYLADHVVIAPKEFPESLWEIAAQLPFEGFRGASKTSAWKSTTRKMK